MGFIIFNRATTTSEYFLLYIIGFEIHNVYTMRWNVKGMKNYKMSAQNTVCVISCFPAHIKEYFKFVLACQKVIVGTVLLVSFCLYLRN